MNNIILIETDKQNPWQTGVIILPDAFSIELEVSYKTINGFEMPCSIQVCLYDRKDAPLYNKDIVVEDEVCPLLGKVLDCNKSFLPELKETVMFSLFRGVENRYYLNKSSNLLSYNFVDMSEATKHWYKCIYNYIKLCN